ncbi:MAG TPA: DUF2461 domain-containing protein [Acidimicrobiia bacterium]|jgi:uncharacterized protein (TIGR02453 family)
MAAYFTPDLFSFLEDLAAHNDREWFNDNKSRYQESVQEPALRFIADCAPGLAKISSHFVADPRSQGGSLFRIYRDTRFSRDKTPYKTYTGIQLRHETAGDAHAPGYYLHLQPGGCFMGAGVWHPETAVARNIRSAIAADPTGWKRATQTAAFRKTFQLEGHSLARVPAGLDPQHQFAEDLRRKDFMAVARLDDDEVTSMTFLKDFTATLRGASPFMVFLCAATGAAF